MPFPNPDTQFKPGQSGNPDGPKPGYKHISTHIQEALNDPDFELKLKDGSILKEMPLKAIIKTAVAKSVGGDTRAMDWLAKYGYGNKLEIVTEDPVKVLLDKFGVTKEIENDRKGDEPISDPSKSGS